MMSLANLIKRYLGMEVKTSEASTSSTPESDDENGLRLNGKLIPEEILESILACLQPREIIKCRLVCMLWKEAIDNRVWHIKLKSILPSRYFHWNFKIPWICAYWMCIKKPFGRNLLKNNCGQDQLKHWRITANGGNRFVVEDPPIGCDTVPESEDFTGCTSCFATSFSICSKEQVVNFEKEGLVPEFMDKFQPDIHVGEWFAGRFDCACEYNIAVMLLDEKLKVLHKFEDVRTVDQFQGRNWEKVEHTFSNYGPGVRYINFFHSGKDRQFWAGHYGSKMSGAFIKVLLTPQ